MKTLALHSVFFALISLVLSPLAVVHASPHHIATLSGHADGVRSVSFSPDGSIIVSGSWDGTIKLWDIELGKAIATFEESGVSLPRDRSFLINLEGGAVSFSPDTDELTFVSGSSDGTVKLWDVATGQIITTFSGHTEEVTSVSFSPDGSMIASSAWDDKVKLWDVATGTNLATLIDEPLWRGVTSVSFSPDGSTLASGAPGGTTLWDVATRTNLGFIPDAVGWGVTSVSFSSDSKILATGSREGTLRLWNVATKANLATLVDVPMWEEVRSVSFAPAGPMLASGLRNGTVEVWDVVTKQKLATFSEHTEAISSVSFAPYGSTLASGSFDGTIKLWDTSEWTPPHPQRLVKIGDGQWGSPRAQLAAPFVVLVLDQDGVAFAGATVSFAVTTGGGTLSAVTATTAANGRAATTLTLGSEPGTNIVEATVDGLKSATFIATAVVQASLTKVSGDGQEGPAGTQLANPFVVSVLDQNGAAFAGAVVTFSVIAGGGTLSSATVTTAANGRAATTLTLGSESGTNAVAATVAGLEPVTFTATAAETPHSLTKVSGNGQGGPASTQLAAPFVVSVLDQDGSPLAGAVVTFSATVGGGMLSSTTDANPCTVGASTSSITATTDANGQAATRLTLGSEPGTNTVAATVAGLEPVTFTATAAEQATPHSLTKVCGESQEGVVSEQLAKPFVVSVSDEDGAAMAGVVVSFSVTAGGGRVSSATATTDANGRAAIRLTLGSDAGTNAVAATVDGLESVIFTATGEKSAIASLFDAFLGGGKLVALPDNTLLLQNAPNPFNSQTVLSYFLLEPSLTRLEVFALTGQRIAVLHQGPQQAGYHQLHWDGRDAEGHSVASGTYLYRLVTDEVVLTRKLMLLR